MLFRIGLRVTGNRAAGLLASAIFLGNANWQYLQSCPLTEPLYTALSLLAMDSLLRWREQPEAGLPWASASWVALGAFCRYEGWLLLAGVLTLLAFEGWRRAIPRREAIRAALAFAGVFIVPALAHFGYLYAMTGESFFHRVARGNPEPYFTFKRPVLSAVMHLGELAQISAAVPLVFAIGGIAFTLSRRDRLLRWLPLFLLWLPSLLNVAALYWGLIYRVRYSALLVPAVAVFSGLLVLSHQALWRTFTASVLVVASLPWLTPFFPRAWEYRATFPGPGVAVLPLFALAAYLWARARRRCFWPGLALCVAGMQLPVLYVESRPILAETREHDYIEPERQAVLEYLRGEFDGSRILIDVARLAPLMYDSGLAVRAFIYNEGRQEEWVRALRSPASEAGWIVMEQGDELWNLHQVDPRWAERYALAVRTNNYRLYRLQGVKPGGAVPARQLE
jgi:hypothetical protein